MAWTTLNNPVEKINVAGRMLASEAADYEALEIINNWRSAHSYPLHIHSKRLKIYTKMIDRDGIVARRLKRLSSIEAKLQRFPSMKLSQMQDTGGCRAIVSSVSKVRELTKSFKESSRKHILVHEDDYLETPQKTGYRGIHLIYRYESDKTSIFNGRKIEIQIRSSLQHMWATAVEVYGTITNQMLKSNRGQDDWLRFFALMGTVIATREKGIPIPNTPSKNELKLELRSYVEQLDVLTILENYGDTIQTSLDNEEGADFFLVKLNPDANEVSVKGFKEVDFVQAGEEYLKAEKTLKDNPRQEIVLVAVESVRFLQRAYPNYFLDTKSFLDLVRKAII